MKKTSVFIRSLQVIGFILALVFVERFCHRQTSGFQISKIESTHPFNPPWETPKPSEEEQKQIRDLLNQRYTFFSYGGQSYVFLSEDETVVLKFFKQHHLRVPNWIKQLPMPKSIRKKWIDRRESQFHLFFNSCKIAFDDFRDRMGLIYLHLNPTNYLHQQITIIDKLGIEHRLDMDHIDFALQYRATLPKNHFHELKRRNDYASAKKSLDSLIDMMIERSQKAIADRDPSIRRNCGFIGNRAVEIDLGSYTRNEALKIPFLYKADIYQKTPQLTYMISKYYPELSDYLDQRLEEIWHN